MYGTAYRSLSLLPLQSTHLKTNWINTGQWDNCYSSFCSFFSGVRQGEVLSPVLFNVYINSLVKVLVESELGCHLHSEYVGCLIYADDILITAELSSKT